MEKLWASEGAGFHIILSRAPIDVLRMSDFENIQSCHSPGSTYWQCAHDEATEGGPIAYLVSNQQLSNLGRALAGGRSPALLLQRDRVQEEYDRMVEAIGDTGVGEQVEGEDDEFRR